MTVIMEPPVKAVRAEPTVAPPVAPAKKTAIWPWVVAAAALLLLGLGLLFGYTTLSSDIEALKDDVASLEADVGTLNSDLVWLESGYSLTREHLAQAPAEASLSLGAVNEHLAQTPVELTE
jgi:hypothetical protein